jgi:hypothetical protein
MSWKCFYRSHHPSALLNTYANSIQTPIRPSNALPNEKYLRHKRYSNLKFLILPVTPNQTAGTSKIIFKKFLKDGKIFPKNDPKGHFRGATCRPCTFATEYFHYIDEFSLTSIVVRQTFENAIRPFHGYSRGDVASSSIVVFQSIGKYIATLNYMVFCPIQQVIQPGKAYTWYYYSD